MMQRLVKESLFLSCTSRLSEKLIGFFESGFLSPLFTSCKKTDSFVHDRITVPLNEKTGFRSRITMRARYSFARFAENNPVMRLLRSAQSALVSSPLRSSGIFLLTFGIYAAAVFFLKRYAYITLGSSDPDDLSASAAIVVAGLLLVLFGERSIVSALSTSRTTGYAVASCLGINEAYLRYGESSKTYSGLMFLAGSVCGIATLFIAPAKLLLWLLLFVLGIAVMNIPELGLLLSIVLLPVVPTDFLLAAVTVTAVSYLFKLARLKRSLHFGSADAAVLLCFVFSILDGVFSPGGFSEYDSYAVCFISLYFLMKNLIHTEKLISQTVNCLSLSASVGMVFYLVNTFCEYIPPENLKSAISFITGSAPDAGFIGIFVACMLPFAFVRLKLDGGSRGALLQLALSAACIAVTDLFSAYIMLLISLFVYIALGYKAPAGAMLGAAIVLPPAVVYASYYAGAAVNEAIVGDAVNSTAVLGFGAATALGAESFYGGLLLDGGVVLLMLFVLAALLVLQRLLGCIRFNNEKKTVRLCGAVSASVAVLLICGIWLNFYADMRAYALLWLMLGTAGSLFTVFVKESHYTEGEIGYDQTQAEDQHS